MSEEQRRSCPVPACHGALGTTKNGDPWLFCKAHYRQLPGGLQIKLWTRYKAWQRLERQWLSLLPGFRSAGLASARAEAVKSYIVIRDECIREVSDGEAEQLDLAQ